MNKSFFNKLKKDRRYTKEEKKLICSIIDAMNDIKVAREYFQMVKDPGLIDYAIYMEEAAKARYTYLLNEAKDKKIKLQYKYVLDEYNAV
ncbi:YaaL family protein [Clostridium sp. MSJ-11]|uniref:YaaL family protein n=1 Tax=Clostridium mobile TaxID=2841512 RepID=A0ABS6EMQ9_9CLOT|nr:YaaL family protein [Clostridium mobile]MBU5486511.1 YaaL family protein [Clostridium mobile]